MSLFTRTLTLSMVAIAAAGCFATGGDPMRKLAESYDPNKNTSAAEAPPPVTFPAAEPMLAPAAKAWAAGEAVTVLRAYLTSTNWDIVRHQVSGNILRRKASTRLYYRGANGPKELATGCYRKDFCVLSQDNMGGNVWG